MHGLCTLVPVASIISQWQVRRDHYLEIKMARQATPTPKPIEHSPKTIKSAIERLKVALKAMEEFDYDSIDWDNSGALEALNANIALAVERGFGENTTAANRFSRASYNSGVHSITFGGGRPSDAEYRRDVKKDVQSNVPLIKEAISTLESDLADMDDTAAPVMPLPVRSKTNKVFIVHGHDEAAKTQVARFLENIDIEAVILHEQANRGRTIIEKIEAHSDVDFAVVLLTPDDQGNKVGEPPEPRARQNVLLELGYFMAKLGRSNVAAFAKAPITIPTDFAGVVWEPFDAGWKTALVRELDAAGFTIDWKKALSS